MSFPITVSDENNQEKLDRVLPVMGTPLKIRLRQYLPDLKWKTTAVEHKSGGIVAKLTITGENLKQDVWLSSNDPARQSITSSIGGVALKRIHDPNTVEKLLRELIDANAVGILSVWPDDSNTPLDYVVKPGETLAVPKTKYKLSFLDYLSHYSIDAKTKKVINRTDKRPNPAVKVRVDDGEKNYEQWLWSKFPSSPHKKLQVPLRMKFTDFNLSGTDGKYILVVAQGSEPRILFIKDAKMHAKKTMLGESYPFANKQYSFTIDKVFEHALIKTDWANNSEKLLRPAVVATVEHDDTVQEAVLELNKPFHHKTRFGTVVLLYRRQTGPSERTN
ncbi:MAG: hypothetical protein GWN67_24435 [Phycisphaerae bacterium]|nr:hypothetical protein [Phycisphaerae bacterium]NIP51284.1 hypothetical protein [Phycisphaerae bacterium]NIS54021.1 hypothetical protein [Phycisphaerae bacterium]NIU11629.1 hypothetical protein [Phycisphaerae bacterium]NIU59415.1 hypothetical protein [Phycisphaerae bacterium]